MAKRENGKERGYLWQELVEWYNGGKRKGTNIRRGSNGTAMMFAAKPMSKTTTREEGMIVCFWWEWGRKSMFVIVVCVTPSLVFNLDNLSMRYLTPHLSEADIS